MRRTPLRPGPGPARRTPLAARNEERRAAAYARNFGPHAAWIRELPCCVCGDPVSHPHHVTSRGAGGTAADLVPLCWRHHGEVHQLGVETFAERFGIDLREVAARLAQRDPAP